MGHFTWDGEEFAEVEVGKLLPPELREIKRWLGASIFGLEDTYEIGLALCYVSVRRARPGFKTADADRLWDFDTVIGFLRQIGESEPAVVEPDGTDVVLSPTPPVDEGSPAG